MCFRKLIVLSIPMVGMISSFEAVIAPMAGRGISRKRFRDTFNRAKAAPRMIRLALSKDRSALECFLSFCGGHTAS